MKISLSVFPQKIILKLVLVEGRKESRVLVWGGFCAGGKILSDSLRKGRKGGVEE